MENSGSHHLCMQNISHRGDVNMRCPAKEKKERKYSSQDWAGNPHLQVRGHGSRLEKGGVPSPRWVLQPRVEKIRGKKTTPSFELSAKHSNSYQKQSSKHIQWSKLIQ